MGIGREGDPNGDWKGRWIQTSLLEGLEGTPIRKTLIGSGCGCWKIIQMKLLEVDRIWTSIGRVERDGDWKDVDQKGMRLLEDNLDEVAGSGSDPDGDWKGRCC